jgi:hypothetical protein
VTVPNTTGVERAPYLSLGEALRVVEQIHEQGAGSVTLETLSPILGNSVKSSSFQRKLSALRTFELVDLAGERVSLTRLALGYVAPTSDAEKADAVFQAFRNVPFARTLHDRYGGGLLPGRDIMANVLLREYGVTDPNNLRWTDFFLTGLRTAGLLNQVGGRASVLTKPGSLGAGPDRMGDAVPPAPGGSAGPRVGIGWGGDGAAHQPPTQQRANPPMGGTTTSQTDMHRVELPLADGSAAVVILPKTASGDDIDDVIAMLEVMKKRALRKRPEPSGMQDDDPNGR